MVLRPGTYMSWWMRIRFHEKKLVPSRPQLRGNCHIFDPIITGDRPCQHHARSCSWCPGVGWLLFCSYALTSHGGR